MPDKKQISIWVQEDVAAAFDESAYRRKMSRTEAIVHLMRAQAVKDGLLEQPESE